jgi:hypothetical protein
MLPWKSVSAELLHLTSLRVLPEMSKTQLDGEQFFQDNSPSNQKIFSRLRIPPQGV